MKKYKVKKSIKIIVILLFITIIALLLITSIKKTKSYSLEYSIDNYERYKKCINNISNSVSLSKVI